MGLSINSWVHFNNTSANKNGNAILQDVYPRVKEPADLYRLLSYNYMKFFKMDLLCKWAWLGAECLLRDGDKHLYDGIDRNKVAVVLMTQHGSIDVDKKYLATMSGIPSPALFVYTLPNIMLGEICIRHGFKGEQLCLVSDGFDVDEVHFWVSDLLHNRGMEACICGFADAYDNNKDICFFWITKQDGQTRFTTDNLTQLYNQ